MELKDRITFNLAGLSAGQTEKFKKAAAKFVPLDTVNGETWENITPAKVSEKFANILLARVEEVDKEEATITYTDMST